MSSDAWVIIGATACLLTVQTTILMLFINAAFARLEATLDSSGDALNSKLDTLGRDIDGLHE